MSFRGRMHPKVSNAEIDVFKALSATGLTEGMLTQRTLVLKSTTPDFCWPEKRKVLYLDGSAVHTKSKQEKRDEEIDEMLTAKGWEVLRILYDAPMSKEVLDKVMDLIKEFLAK